MVFDIYFYLLIIKLPNLNYKNTELNIERSPLIKRLRAPKPTKATAALLCFVLLFLSLFCHPPIILKVPFFSFFHFPSASFNSVEIHLGFYSSFFFALFLPLFMEYSTLNPFPAIKCGLSNIIIMIREYNLSFFLAFQQMTYVTT